jgi:hypothetical protein
MADVVLENVPQELNDDLRQGRTSPSTVGGRRSAPTTAADGPSPAGCALPQGRNSCPVHYSPSWSWKANQDASGRTAPS